MNKLQSLLIPNACPSINHKFFFNIQVQKKSKHKAGLVPPPKKNKKNQQQQQNKTQKKTTKVYFNIKALKFKDCLILIQIDI